MSPIQQTTLVFPVHPRTTKNLHKFGYYDLLNDAPGIILTDPLGYKAFMNLVFSCKFVITDSGGIQKEAYWLGVPCITLRNETEWVETIESGWNTLVGADKHDIINCIANIDKLQALNPEPIYGNGDAAGQIWKILKKSSPVGRK